jgi:hypothetical protein
MTKKALTLLSCIALLCLVALPVAAAAADGSWNGWITDAACGAKGANAAHKACAEKCAKTSKLVLYNTDDKKIYKLDKQDLAKQHVGDEVTVTGKVEGNEIAVDSITAKGGK